MKRTNRKSAFASAALAVASMVAAAPAFAGAASNPLTVTASVTGVCVITPGTLAFGNYDPVGVNATAPLTGSGTLSVACTKGTLYSVTLGAGNNAAAAVGTTRAMKDAGSGAFLSYEIYTSNTYGTVWNMANTVGGTAASTSVISLTAWGRIPAGQNVPAGAGYTDTVTSTVNF